MDPEIKDDPENPSAAGQLAFESVTAILKRGTDVDSCATLAGTIDKRIEQSVEHVRKEGAPIACQAGCSFCCHIRVTVVPHEAIALFRHLRSKIPAEQAQLIADRVLANAATIGAMTVEQHWATNVKCAFLVDGRCSAYENRPMVCACHHSLSKNECEYSYNNPSDLSDGIPKLEVLQDIKDAAQSGIAQALDGLGLSYEMMELHTAVAALLRDPSLISRWRSGRNLLKAAKSRSNT